MADIHSLNGTPIIPPGTPVPEIVQILSELLADAQAGKIRSLGCAFDHSEHGPATEFHLEPSTYATMMGTIEILKLRVGCSVVAREFSLMQGGS